MLTRIAVILCAALLLCPAIVAQPGQQRRAVQSNVPAGDTRYTATYSRMLRAVASIPIYDNHSHVGFAEDSDVDAMSSPPAHEPLRLRLDNPELIDASRELFAYPWQDNKPEHLQWLAAQKTKLRKQYPGYGYFNRILDKLNVETVVANRVALGSYLDPKRFRWVFFVDSFLFPLDNSEMIARNGDLAVFVPLQEKKLRQEMKQGGLAELPASFDEYLQFVSRVVEQNQQHGGVGIKFEIAYFRSLHFDDPPQAAAAAIYERYRKGGKPSAAEQTVLEDFLFRYLLREAGRLHLAVQIHTAVGIGDYFSVSGGNVLNLENVLRDPRYGNVKFVLLHGGYPFQEQAIWLAALPNVYLDSSLMGIYLYPADLKTVLRHWLLLYPEKVVFGSDAFPFNESVGAEESHWLAVTSARRALAAALTEMILNGEVTEERALTFAHGFLHDNAAGIYATPTAPTAPTAP